MNDYLLRKLHSLSGLLPVGAFVLEHFYTNLKAVGPRGAENFDGVVRDLQGNPLVLPAEILLIALPLCFHAIYGLFISARARPNNATEGYLRNWMFTLQRASGVILFFYIGYHVLNTRLGPYLDPQNPLWQSVGGRPLVSYAFMQHYLGSTHLGIPVVSLYIIGVAATAFHLANGLWNMGLHWGITVGPRAQRLSALFCGLFGVALFGAGMTALLAFVKPGTQLVLLP